MIRPEYLKEGDKIGLVATARKINPIEIAEATETFVNWGLEVFLGDHVFGQDNQFSGSDKERASDLQNMIDRKDIKAIICVRGGYGTVRVVDRINWKKLKESPKWLVGFSDITIIHSHLNRQVGMESIHSLMPLNFATASHAAINSLRKALFGKELKYSIASHKLNKTGSAEAEIVGGNLSIIYNVTGSISDIDTKGKILFLEDLDEYLYHIDRMMMNLWRAGKLDKLKGLIIGGMTEMNDNKVPFGKDAYQIIHDIVKAYSYPVCFNFPAGHFPDNRALILGRKVKLEVASKVKLTFEN